jgi:hypothetical protein
MATTGKNAIMQAILLMKSTPYITISEANKALIMAQEKVFSFLTVDEWKHNTQTYYDRKYNEAMSDAYANYPDDVDVATLYAESIVNLSPWQYYVQSIQPPVYDENRLDEIKILTGSVQVALEVIRKVIARAPHHALALHLWIHITESSSNPAEGLHPIFRINLFMIF